jgi:uncharacterized protein YneF (UPF0154 family)
MRQALALPLATLICAGTAAIMATAIAWLLWLNVPADRVDLGFTAFVAFVVCIPYVMIVGLPIGLFLVHKRMFRAVPALIAGAIAASPIPLISLVSAVIRKPHEAAFALTFLLMAIFSGALSGLAFYWTHRLMSPNNSFKPNPLRGSA